MVFLAKRLGDITTDDVVAMIPVFFIVCVVICIISWAIIKKKDSENDELPVNGMMATIVDMPRPEPNAIMIVTWVLFETADGKRVRVSCKGNNNYVVGDKGFLKWQGTRLISFERQC